MGTTNIGHDDYMADRATLDGAAFPLNEKNGDGGHYQTHLGMTIRDYFASTVVAVLYERLPEMTELSEVAKRAYAMADAMLEARTK